MRHKNSDLFYRNNQYAIIYNFATNIFYKKYTHMYRLKIKMSTNET